MARLAEDHSAIRWHRFDYGRHLNRSQNHLPKTWTNVGVAKVLRSCPRRYQALGVLSEPQPGPRRLVGSVHVVSI